MQLNQEIFQTDSLSNNQNALEIPEYFENNDLKAQLLAKDTTICKLKEHIKSMRENDKEEKVKHEMDEIETINIELEHSVAKLLSKNERLHKESVHLKKIHKDQFDSIKKTHALSKEHGKETIENAAQILIATTIALGMFKIDLEPLAPRITPKKIVHLKETTSNLVETPKLEIKVYSKRPKKIKSVGSSKKTKIVESKIANNSEPTQLWGSNATDVPSSSSLINDRVYYVEGLGHNLFSVGQFCDADLEVSFRKNTSFIRNLEDVDLLSGSRDTKLYTISLDVMLNTSPICLLSKASKTKSWLWDRRLSHLNFDTLKKLAKDGFARGILKLKFQKDHLCSACALGKSKKSSHQPIAKDTNQEKLNLLHIDLCGPMRVESINGKKYILVIVDDYS
ncbi:retrovirus-related pol polyprotein from transposon TNT 1-94 [Tanacetum coccineum]